MVRFSQIKEGSGAKMAIISYSGTYEEYQKLEEVYGNGRNRRCINGRSTGCGKCVGFCKYSGHPGFLTEDQRSAHHCIEKGCNYYLSKPERVRVIKQSPDPAQRLLYLVREAVAGMEGLKVTRVRNDNGSWVANYVTLSNDYQLDQIEKSVNLQSGLSFRFNRLNLDFDTCVQIVMGV